MTSKVIDNFYLSESDLENSPSRLDGVDSETESALRLYGCEVIQEAVVLLGLPQVVAATGQVLLHRFICKRSLKKFHIKKSAFACVWLACKLEEQVHSNQLNKINVVFERIYARREGLPLTIPDPAIDSAVQWNTEINTRYELEMLKAFGFICHIDHPHKLVCNLIGFIFMDGSERGEDSTPSAPTNLTQEAWNLANDSLRTTLCVRLRSEVVACGCIYLASRRLGIAMPENPGWWTLFGVQLSDIHIVCREILSLYTRDKARYISVNRANDPAKADPARAEPAAAAPAEAREKSEPAQAGLDSAAVPDGTNADLPPPPPVPVEPPAGFKQGSTAQDAKKRSHADEERGRGWGGGQQGDERSRSRGARPGRSHNERRGREYDSRDHDRDRDRAAPSFRGDHRRRHRDDRDDGGRDRRSPLDSRDGKRRRADPAPGDDAEGARSRAAPPEPDAAERSGSASTANGRSGPAPQQGAAKVKGAERASRDRAVRSPPVAKVGADAGSGRAGDLGGPAQEHERRVSEPAAGPSNGDAGSQPRISDHADRDPLDAKSSAQHLAPDGRKARPASPAARKGSNSARAPIRMPGDTRGDAHGAGPGRAAELSAHADQPHNRRARDGEPQRTSAAKSEEDLDALRALVSKRKRH